MLHLKNITLVILGLLILSCSDEDELDTPCYEFNGDLTTSESYFIHDSINGSFTIGLAKGRFYDSTWLGTITDYKSVQENLSEIRIRTVSRFAEKDRQHLFSNRIKEVLILSFEENLGCIDLHSGDRNQADHLLSGKLEYLHLDGDVFLNSYLITDHPSEFMNILEITDITQDSIFGRFNAYFEREFDFPTDFHPLNIAIYNCEFAVAKG